MAKRQSGFTLIEILIVVIILGILAAIVIPQFTSASADAKQSAVSSMVQSVRGQIELYKLNHGDTYPALAGSDWTSLTSRSLSGGQTYGPYMQSSPINPFNQSSLIGAAVGSGTGQTNGWAMVGDSSTGTTKFKGLGKDGAWIGE